MDESQLLQILNELEAIHNYLPFMFIIMQVTFGLYIGMKLGEF